MHRFVRKAKSLYGDYHNMPERFVKKHTNFISVRRPRLPQYEEKIRRYKKEPYYDRWRPWETQFERLNAPGVKTRRIFVEPIREWSFFRGDRVEILKGPDAGKQGIINYIVRERNWVFVEGLNLKREKSPVGMITCEEQPLLVPSEVALVDPSDLRPAEFEWRVDDKGERLRVSLRTERIIPVPKQAEETIDYTTKDTYKELPKDTPAKLANKITFKPANKTFEMQILEEMGVKEDRVPYPMFWY